MNIQETIRRILREETELPIYFKRRIDIETLEQTYQYVLKVASKRYTDKKKQLNAMTPYKFNHLVTSNLIEDVCENFELECGDDENRFNQLWDFLNDLYSKRNIKHFYDIRKKLLIKLTNVSTSDSCYFIFILRELLFKCIRHGILNVSHPNRVGK